MNKKFLSAILFGALMVSSTGTFVSCKDYDDDIDNLQTQITANADAIKKLQDLMGQGQYVTGVTKTSAGLVFSMSNGGASVTIPVVDGKDGKDGKDGTIITVDPTTKNWIIDGKDTGICAQGTKGDKGDQGENGESGTGVSGHSPKIDAATGCWTVWDDANQEWVVTSQSAIGAQTYVVKHDNPEYWELNVMQQGADGNNIGFQSITLPVSGTLMSITPELNGQNYAQNFKIYYGILEADQAWTGHKAVGGKMLAGMYPTMDRDIKMQLNPSDVDANNYNWSFVSTDASDELWGLEFGTPSPWAGKATVETRAIASPNGLWSLPREIEMYTFNSSTGHGREDYAGQFKSNDGKKYLFALEGESEIDGQTVKSPYVYTFQASNINKVSSILTPTLTYAPSGSKFIPRVEYTPNFDTYFSNDHYDSDGDEVPDSVLIYDYKLELDPTMTNESIKRYGLRITDDGYRFAADKDAVINNSIDFVYHYILINGNTGQTTFTVNFSDEAFDVVDKNIGSIKGAFDAKLWGAYKATSIDNPLAIRSQIPNCDYVYYKDLSLADFFKALGTDGKDKWIDAIARSYGNNTDPKEINKAVFERKADKDDKEFTVELLGGDPINNQGQTDIQMYNGFLLNEYITFDYVDAAGMTCLTGTSRDLDNIASLRVYFGVNSKMGHVTVPYYTTDGQIFNETRRNCAALPLNNAFRIELATRYDQYEISKVNFEFELKAPECPIKRVNVATDKAAKWNETYDLLTVYGEKRQSGDAFVTAGDLKDAFSGAFTISGSKYTPTLEASYYELVIEPISSGVLVGSTGGIATLNQISSSTIYTDWNTWGHYTPTTFDSFSVMSAAYNHFNVYPVELPGFNVQFASKVANSQKHEVTATPIDATAKYDANGVLTGYEVTVSEGNFNMVDALGDKYKLFDTSSKTRKELNQMWNDRECIDDAAPMYGLNPVALVNGSNAGANVRFTLPAAKKTQLNIWISPTLGGAANNAVDVTLNVTDVFGHSTPVKFVINTLK